MRSIPLTSTRSASSQVRGSTCSSGATSRRLDSPDAAAANQSGVCVAASGNRHSGRRFSEFRQVERLLEGEQRVGRRRERLLRTGHVGLPGRDVFRLGHASAAEQALALALPWLPCRPCPHWIRRPARGLPPRRQPARPALSRPRVRSPGRAGRPVPGRCRRGRAAGWSSRAYMRFRLVAVSTSLVASGTTPTTGTPRPAARTWSRSMPTFATDWLTMMPIFSRGIPRPDSSSGAVISRRARAMPCTAVDARVVTKRISSASPQGDLADERLEVLDARVHDDDVVHALQAAHDGLVEVGAHGVRRARPDRRQQRVDVQPVGMDEVATDALLVPHRLHADVQRGRHELADEGGHLAVARVEVDEAHRSGRPASAEARAIEPASRIDAVDLPDPPLLDVTVMVIWPGSLGRCSSSIDADAGYSLLAGSTTAGTPPIGGRTGRSPAAPCAMPMGGAAGTGIAGGGSRQTAQARRRRTPASTRPVHDVSHHRRRPVTRRPRTAGRRPSSSSSAAARRQRRWPPRQPRPRRAGHSAPSREQVVDRRRILVREVHVP